MKKAIIIACLAISALIILDSLRIDHWLILLFLAGVVPGTNILISPIDMMAATATAITIIVLRLTLWPRIKPAVKNAIGPVVPTKQRSTHRRTSSARA